MRRKTKQFSYFCVMPLPKGEKGKIFSRGIREICKNLGITRKILVWRTIRNFFEDYPELFSLIKDEELRKQFEEIVRGEAK